MAKKSTTNGIYGDAEGFIKAIVIDSEYTTGEQNNREQVDDYERIIDMLELQRQEKDTDWNSDIFLPLLFAHCATDMASYAAQDFQSRDFVGILLEGNQLHDKERSEAAKLLLNALLNDKDVYHFQKRIRSRTINWLFGQVWAVMWPEQKVITKMMPQPPIPKMVQDYDADGNLVPKQIMEDQPDLPTEVILYDRVQYDVFDSRNVFTDFSYTYSAQQKRWIILRSEKTLSDIRADAERMGYINLDILQQKIFDGSKKRKVTQTGETETSKLSFNKPGGAYSPKVKIMEVDPSIDILDRYGKIWAIVTERDEDGIPTSTMPGYTDIGELDDKAELVESIITFASVKGEWIMIGFRPTWAIDAKGQPYKPILRGWCYVHPTKDIGLSDGKNIRELQKAQNDVFNLGLDRSLLATMGVFKGRRDAIQNNPDTKLSPGGIVLLENIQTDLEQLQVTDNPASNYQMLSFINGIASQTDAITPTVMGMLPDKTSTTATAVTGADNRANARGNLKNITWSYTFDNEFYTMILQMVYRFMRQETVDKILGEELKDYFDPNATYTYVPISANLEGEANKRQKVQTYDQMMGRIMGLAKLYPKEVGLIAAMIMAEQCKLLGKDLREVEGVLNQLANAKPQEEGKGAESVKDGKEPPTSNQQGIEMGAQEMSVRGV